MHSARSLFARARFAPFVIAVLTLALAPGARTRAQEPKADAADQILIDLVAGTSGLNEKTFTKGEYKAVRGSFTKYFEAKHGPAIKLALGADADPLFADAVGRRGVDVVDAEIEDAVEQHADFPFAGQPVGGFIFDPFVPADLERAETQGGHRRHRST